MTVVGDEEEKEKEVEVEVLDTIEEEKVRSIPAVVAAVENGMVLT